jgi:hypothetical protein
LNGRTYDDHPPLSNHAIPDLVARKALIAEFENAWSAGSSRRPVLRLA